MDIGGDSFGGMGGGGYGSAADYLNSLYGGSYDDMSGGQGEAQFGTGAYTTGARYNSQPQRQMPSMPGGGGDSKATTPFGQWQNAGMMTPGGNASFQRFMRPRTAPSSDMDYATFLKFMAEIGPMLFGTGRGQNPAQP